MKKFAVFDIDGTLIRWQLYHAIVDQLASHGHLGKNAKQTLHDARMTWKNRESPKAFSQYEKILISVYEDSIHNINLVDFDQLVNNTIEEYKNQTHTYTRDLLKSLKSKKYFLIAISGSHHELVEKLANYYGFDAWQGTEYERIGQNFSGNKFVPSLDKAKALRKIIEKNQLSMPGSYAIGDSQSDASMLKVVDNPIAFNPNQELYKIAKNNNWQIVVERKNVVYRLNLVDNVYQLARN